MARSEKKTDIWGNEYVQHYDDDGNETGRSEAKKNIWGDSYTEHRDKGGDVVGESREKSTWLGDKYTEHRDADGDVSGRSEQKSTWLGDRYSEHRDKDDNVVGESREKSTWLGDKYVEYTPSESSGGSAGSSGRAGGGYSGGSGGGEPQLIGCALIIMCCLGGVCYKMVASPHVYVPPPVWTPPAPAPRPAPRPAPTLTGCTLVSSTEFHLRVGDNASRAGSVRVSPGVRVQVLQRGVTTRRSDVAHRVRTEDGREGWMFLDPSRLDGDDCAAFRGPIVRAEPPAVSVNCLGRWQGTGHNDPSHPWAIDMVVTAERGARCGTIEYPSLGCGGYLENCERRGDTVTWTEIYTHNPGTCAPAGRIDASCDGNTMRWTWTGQEVVSSQLQRVQ